MSLSLSDRSLVFPILLAVIILFAIVVFRTAWVNEDAYITFRTVDNFVNGYGLTWNVSERVETYSNPLWMFLVSLFYFFTNEIYYTSIILSITISVLAVLIFAFKISKTLIGAILGIGIFIFSKPFIDFSTSGLENPLTHLIIAIFLLVYIKSRNNFDFKTLFFLSIITAFGVINRLDTLVLFLPCLVYVFLKLPKVKGLYIITVGLLPAIIWKGFTLFYYGFPLPNTAYAKVLNTGLDKIVLVQEGLFYFENLIRWHPLTFFIIMTGISIPFLIKEKRLIPIMLGIILYIIVVIQSGGDQMTGRLFSAPLFVAVILLSQVNFTAIRRHVPLLVLSSIVIVVGVITPNSPLFSDENYNILPDYNFSNNSTVADLRGLSHNYTGLLKNLPFKDGPYHPFGILGEKIKADNTSPIIKPAIGTLGFHAGPEIHIIDPLALGDPLLSKLPLTPKENYYEVGWRIAHYWRTIPTGYFETIQSGENMIEDECLAKYYDKLSLITRGNLFDGDRIQEIWNMNTGKYDYLVDAYINGKENSQNSEC